MAEFQAAVNTAAGTADSHQREAFVLLFDGPYATAPGDLAPGVGDLA